MKLNQTYFKYALFSIVLGITATLWKYFFGIGDQLDHLLFVYKALDHSFLNNDPYVSLASQFSVRYYFAVTMAFISKFSGVDAAFFSVTLLTNIAVSYYTFSVAYALAKNHVAACMASVLVMTLTTINMGDVFTLYAKGLAPDRIAFALILMATFQLIKGRAFYATIILGCASLFHILLGFILGSILLFSRQFILRKHQYKFTTVSKIALYYSILLLFAAATLAPLYLTNNYITQGNELIDIYARFRVPHHIMASNIFANGIGRQALAFLFSGVLAWLLLYRSPTIDKNILRFIGIIIVILSFLCGIGYLFTEIFPSRYGVMLQAFRYLTYYKWLSLILFGVYIGKSISERHSIIPGCYLLISTLSPILLACSLTFEYLRHKTQNLKTGILFQPVIYLVCCLIFLIFKNQAPETMVLFILTFIVIALYYFRWPFSWLIAGIYLTFIGLNTSTKVNDHVKNSNIKNWLSDNYKPVFNFKETEPDLISLCQNVESLPKKCLFLAPPKLLEIRTIGKRASLVNFKTVPFKPADLVLWKKKLDDCYGTTLKQGFAAENELEQNYKSITDKHLADLILMYGITHVVLFTETPTKYPVPYQNNTYKIAKLSNN